MKKLVIRITLRLRNVVIQKLLIINRKVQIGFSYWKQIYLTALMFTNITTKIKQIIYIMNSHIGLYKKGEEM